MKYINIPSNPSLLGGFALIFSQIIVAEQNAPSSSATRLLTAQCNQCHDTAEGESYSLAGKPFADLYDELIEMKYGDEKNLTHAQAKAYSDTQLWSIADFYANFPDDATSHESKTNNNDPKRKQR